MVAELAMLRISLHSMISDGAAAAAVAVAVVVLSAADYHCYRIHHHYCCCLYHHALHVSVAVHATLIYCVYLAPI
jgi:hypothetical protein